MNNKLHPKNKEFHFILTSFLNTMHRFNVQVEGSVVGKGSPTGSHAAFLSGVRHWSPTDESFCGSVLLRNVGPEGCFRDESVLTRSTPEKYEQLL